MDWMRQNSGIDFFIFLIVIIAVTDVVQWLSQWWNRRKHDSDM